VFLIRAHLWEEALDQTGRAGRIQRSKRRFDGFGEQPMRFVPTAGFVMDFA
jgi:hypothetical protein